MTTATGPSASSKPRIRSRLASVCPCHIERKFRSSTTGIPISAAKQRTMKLLPVPTGPHTRKPIGTTSSRPCRSAAAVSRRSAFAPSFPATASSPVVLVRNVSSPPLASSIRRFFSRVSASGSSAAPFESASARRLSRCRQVSPDVRTETFRASMRENVWGVAPRPARKEYRSRSSGTGTSSSKVRASATSASLSAAVLSETRQNVTWRCRNSGSADQRRSVTIVFRSSTGSWPGFPAGATVSAKSMITAAEKRGFSFS